MSLRAYEYIIVDCSVDAPAIIKQKELINEVERRM